MSIIHQKDKRTGITYVYESKAFWDKEKKQSRAKRTLLGKLDPETNEIIPTDGRGKSRSPYQKVEKTEEPTMEELMNTIKALTLENQALKDKISLLEEQLELYKKDR